MSDTNQRPEGEVRPPTPSLMAAPPDGPVAAGPEARPEAKQSTLDLTAELKRRLEETRLPANLKEQILAELPPLEERERLFRELQEKGGLSPEQFFASLGIEAKPPP
jgi:hypothetical protein